jgi:hypothetical protein
MLAAPILFLAVAALGAQGPDGEGVVRAAHAKYAGKWPTTYTYVQKTILPDGRPETWYHAFQLPNQLRIDVAPSITGRAMLYRSDSLYSYGAKQMKTRVYWPNSFLLLLGDIHVAPPEQTIKRLKAFGFDLNVTHESTWQGKRVIVVGAKKGDLRSKQFWLEKDRMILVRLIEPNALDRSKPMIADIGKYTKLGGGWIEGEVKITLGGTPTQFQEVFDPRVEKGLDTGIFAPGPYRLPDWVGPMPDIWGKPRRVG